MIALLTVTFGILGVTEATWCKGFPDALNKQIGAFEERHRRWNLQASCDLIEQAAFLALNIIQKKPLNVRGHVCSYTTRRHDVFDATDAFYPSHMFTDLPWDKIEKTAKLHQPTTYGCAFLHQKGFLSTYWSSVCLYKKKTGIWNCE
ncbi:hypothetical protein Q1695_015962 [Nippostrongylus brasiliensis]|nr:hypothetical protein Q1695_015962 [Nippostrongylus brasiliensis]